MLKLYYSPGACSLADHIALHEAGMAFERESVDLKTHQTASGADFTTINPKGYVPALVLSSGETVTENIAVLDWIAGQSPALGLDGPMGHTRLLETLAYISTEVHKSFKPMFSGASDSEKAKAGETVTMRLEFLAKKLDGDYLFSDRPSVADCYLFVMLLWCQKFVITIPEPLPAFLDRMMARPAVHTAMQHEGLI